jgi:hypothetical protein
MASRLCDQEPVDPKRRPGRHEAADVSCTLPSRPQHAANDGGLAQVPGFPVAFYLLTFARSVPFAVLGAMAGRGLPLLGVASTTTRHPVATDLCLLLLTDFVARTLRPFKRTQPSQQASGDKPGLRRGAPTVVARYGSYVRASICSVTESGGSCESILAVLNRMTASLEGGFPDGFRRNGSAASGGVESRSI